MPHFARATTETPPGTGRLFMLALLAAVLAWLILTRTFAAYLATVSPATALRLQPNEPTALIARAEAELGAALRARDGEATPGHRLRETLNESDVDRLTGFARIAEQAMKGHLEPPQPEEDDGAEARLGPTPPDAPNASEHAKPAPVVGPILSDAEAASVVALATRAVVADPVDADAVGLLARTAELTGDAGSDALMRHTARLSFRESYALYALMQDAERRGDIASVVRYADGLLRTRVSAGPIVVPVIAHLADTRSPPNVLVETLARNPPWRAPFLRELTRHITDARTPLYLLLALQATPSPPTEAEQAAYIQFLIRRKFYELAYYTWLQFQPREELATLGPLYNRSFEKPHSGLPFDWSLPKAGSTVAEIRPRTDKESDHALIVEFGQGRAAFSGVSQVTLAAPGTYVLSGRYRGRLIGTRGLSWRILCTDGPLLGQSGQILGDAPEWREFTLSFTVPPKGCRAQEVRLDLDARSASEKLVTGSMWFDDLDLRRGS